MNNEGDQTIFHDKVRLANHFAGQDRQWLTRSSSFFELIQYLSDQGIQNNWDSEAHLYRISALATAALELTEDRMSSLKGDLQAVEWGEF